VPGVGTFRYPIPGTRYPTPDTRNLTPPPLPFDFSLLPCEAVLTFISDLYDKLRQGDKLMIGKSIKSRAAFFVLAFIIGFSLTAGYVWAQNSCLTPNAVLGPRTWEEWKAEAGWENYAAGEYSPPQWKVAELAGLTRARNATFIVFGGSWCSDSKVQLPVLFRLFSLASIPAGRQRLYGVNRCVKEPTQTADRYNISRVPTVVVLSNGREIGRIAEFPRPDWADDLIRVLSG